jgi:hypothetical protein
MDYPDKILTISYVYISLKKHTFSDHFERTDLPSIQNHSFCLTQHFHQFKLFSQFDGENNHPLNSRPPMTILTTNHPLKESSPATAATTP